MQDHPSGWRALGASVRGATHARAGFPNQDALAWFPVAGSGIPLILAVADGHGSPRSFRSDTGAWLAVQGAIEALAAFLASQSDHVELAQFTRLGREALPQALVERWQTLVEADFLQHPFTAQELETLEIRVGLLARQSVVEQPLLAYGTTLLAAAVTASCLLYLQLGDGDLLVVSPRGEVSRPLPRDPRLFANETTSLAAQQVWHDLRVALQPLSQEPPALLLLATDGYANSFRDEAAFLQVGSDLWDLLRAEGLEVVQQSLPGWLAETSQAGSGDDITLGLLCRLDALARGSPAEGSSVQEPAPGITEDPRHEHTPSAPPFAEPPEILHVQEDRA